MRKSLVLYILQCKVGNIGRLLIIIYSVNILKVEVSRQEQNSRGSMGIIRRKLESQQKIVQASIFHVYF